MTDTPYRTPGLVLTTMLHLNGHFYIFKLLSPRVVLFLWLDDVNVMAAVSEARRATRGPSPYLRASGLPLPLSQGIGAAPPLISDHQGCPSPYLRSSGLPLPLSQIIGAAPHLISGHRGCPSPYLRGSGLPPPLSQGIGAAPPLISGGRGCPSPYLRSSGLPLPLSQGK